MVCQRSDGANVPLRLSICPARWQLTLADGTQNVELPKTPLWLQANGVRTADAAQVNNMVNNLLNWGAVAGNDDVYSMNAEVCKNFNDG